MNDATRSRVRAALAFLAAIELSTGVWAILAPGNWFRSFPGLGRHWVIGQGGPLNTHLAVDSGSGFLAVGFVVVLAMVWAERRVIQTAAVAVLAHGLPHFLFHVTHPARPAYAFVDLLFGVGGLGFLCVVAAGILIALRAPTRQAVTA